MPAADLQGTSRAATRMADALLRALGGRTVLLHMPAPAVPGDDAEQLGFATPLFTDIALGPVVYRKVFAEQAELLISASAIERIVGSLAFDSAALLFQTVAGVLVDGKLYEALSLTTAEAFGSVYLYRLQLG